jgi:hypothetical protein
MATKSEVDKIYKSLNEEQLQIVAEKMVDGNHSAFKWIKLLRKVALLDKYGDAYRAKQSYIWKIVLAVLVAIASIIAALVSEVYYIFTITAVAIGILIKVILDKNKIRDLDVSNHLRLLLMPLLAILREDIHKNGKISIKAILAPSAPEEYKIKDIPSSGSNYPKVNESHYKIPRIILNTILIDGTSLLLTLTEFMRKRDITKRNPRGKIKNKKKYKLKQVAIIKLQFKKSIYQLKEEGNISKDIIFAENETSYIFKVKITEITRGLQHCVPPKRVIKTIGSVYKLVQPIGKEVAGVE